MNISKNSLYIVALLLLLPALFINLGSLAFIDDEGIRSLVALEMELSGNLITPTMHGEFYYKKPPLFNWILLSWYQLTGTITEQYARIPTVLVLLAYAGTLFAFLKPKYGTKFAFLNAFILITCGRILFWDSMLALIDMTFSWVTFLMFITVYYFFERERYWELFINAYLLTAVGFFLKGLPALVFIACTLLAYFIYRKKFWKLFSIQHIVSVIMLFGIIGTYYAVYNQYNSLENVFTTLFTESSQRTAVKFGLWPTIKHLFTFPFEMVYHFLPWALMIIFYLRKDILKLIQRDRFVAYCVLTFLANIVVYWTSPEVFPRYLLMHAPLLFISYLYLYNIHKKENSWHYHIFEWLLFGVCVLISLASFIPLFLEQTQIRPYYILKTLLPSAILIACTIGYYYQKQYRLIYLCIFLLGFRIGFNFFVLPDRTDGDYGSQIRASAIEAGKTFSSQEMYLYKDSFMDPAVSFYLTNARGSIVPRKFEDFKPDDIYIIETSAYPSVAYEQLGTLKLRHRGRPVYIIGKLKQ